MTEERPSADVVRRDFLKALGAAGALAAPALATFGCSSDWAPLGPDGASAVAFNHSGEGHCEWEECGGESGEGGGESEESGCEGEGCEAETPPNAAPAVSELPDAEILEGETYTATGSFSDPDSSQHIASVSWGDDTEDEAFPLNGTAFSPSHAYTAAGVYTATVTVTDEHGASGASSATVTVLSAAAAVGVLNGMIGALPDGTNKRLARQLRRTVGAAAAKLARGATRIAALLLGAFVFQVRLGVRRRRLDSTAGQGLIDFARRIIRSIRANSSPTPAWRHRRRR